MSRFFEWEVDTINAPSVGVGHDVVDGLFWCEVGAVVLRAAKCSDSEVDQRSA
jgi:hypothetical protein